LKSSEAAYGFTESAASGEWGEFGGEMYYAHRSTVGRLERR
jgi:hypothetical protein